MSDPDIQQRAAGIQAEQKRRLKCWIADKAMHFHGEACQFGVVCQFSETKKPIVQDIDLIINQINGESL